MAENATSKALTREFLAERDLRMFKMRQGGVPVNEIGRRFGVSTSVVSKSIGRQLERLNREALMAYPEVLRMELERLDSLQAAIWPMTQHRRVSLDDGTEIQVEPDMKAIQQVLSIMDRRSKLLGMESNNISIQMDMPTSLSDPIRVSMIGDEASPLSQFSPEEEAKELLQLMAKSGVLPQEEVDKMLGSKVLDVPEEDISDSTDDGIVDAEIIELPLPAQPEDVD
jgi:hypothetical protein